MEANVSPMEPKTPSAMGLPINPALEQMVPYFKHFCLPSLVLTNKTLPKITLATWINMEINKIPAKFLAISMENSTIKDLMILQGKIRSTTRSVIFFCPVFPITPTFLKTRPIIIMEKIINCKLINSFTFKHLSFYYSKLSYHKFFKMKTKKNKFPHNYQIQKNIQVAKLKALMWAMK